MTATKELVLRYLHAHALERTRLAPLLLRAGLSRLLPPSPDLGSVPVRVFLDACSLVIPDREEVTLRYKNGDHRLPSARVREAVSALLALGGSPNLVPDWTERLATIYVEYLRWTNWEPAPHWDWLLHAILGAYVLGSTEQPASIRDEALSLNSRLGILDTGMLEGGASEYQTAPLTAYRMARLVRELREREKYDLNEAADKLGIETHRYQRIEDGSEPFPPDRLLCLPRVYKDLDAQRLFEFGSMAYGMHEAAHNSQVRIGNTEDPGIADYPRLQSVVRELREPETSIPLGLAAATDLVSAFSPAYRDAVRVRFAEEDRVRALGVLLEQHYPINSYRGNVFGLASSDHLRALESAGIKYTIISTLDDG